jgi:energy-coupling factor transport system ATP-binding protein
MLVLDEPTANLDPPAAADFLGHLAELKAAGGTTMVIVEHRVDEVWALADQLLVLGPDGRPVAQGRPDAVLAERREELLAAGVWLPGASVATDGSAATAPHPDGPTRLGRPPRLDVRDLSFAYPGGSEVLRGLDLLAGHGERLAVVGANGSGKSTLARLLVGLLRPDRGAVAIDGRSPHDVAPRERAALAGLVFQDPELGFLAQTVDEEVRLGLPAGPATDAAAMSLMATLGLPLATFGRRSPYRLSGGEQRRLSLAPALLRDPRLLVLDEPTFGQDRAGVVALVARLRELADEGTTVMAISHDERFVAAFGERVVELRDGRLHDRVGP